MIKKIDHIGIAVKSIKDSLPFYTNILKLTLEGIEDVSSENVTVAFLKIGESKLELLQPLTEDCAIARFIDKYGEGIHHIALSVDSIQARIQDMKNNGIKMIHDEAKIGANGAEIAFIHPKSTGNVLYEFCSKREQGGHLND